MPKAKGRYTLVVESTLLAEARLLAKDYRITFNQLLAYCLENAVEEWTVPYMETHDRPADAELNALEEGPALAGSTEEEKG